MRFQAISTDPVMNFSIIVFLILFLFLGFLFITTIIAHFRKKEKGAPHTPPISAIIPAYNEEKNIARCLRSLLNQKYPELEIIVVNDGSTDKTGQKIQAFRKKHPKAKIKIITGDHTGKSDALNKALRFTSHEIILTLDADVTLKQGTLKKLVAPLKDSSVGATNAILLVDKPKKMIEHFQSIEYHLMSLTRTAFSQVFSNSIWFLGAIACYRKSALEKEAFKKDTLTEDMDICLELYNNDHKIITVPDAIVYTKACKSIKELFSQRMRWYYGSLQALRKHRKSLLRQRKKSVAPVAFLYFNQYWWAIFAFLFFPLTTYQVLYWLPTSGIEIAIYLFRWFSISGPFYVLYKLPEWGLSTLNIFGVLSGVITLLMTFWAIKKFKGKITPKTMIGIFFYFPYTILLNVVMIAGIIKYARNKEAFFIGK